MATLITPTTELEAVNECLANIGQSPVSSISGDIGVDAALALQLIRSINRELQVRGWYWNTDYDYPLTPNGDKEILLPANTLSVDPAGDDRNKDYVQRGRKLYDRKNRTYLFDAAVDVEIIFGLEFDELPEAARRYIALRAARIFQNRVEGSNDPEDRESEDRAYADLMAEDMRVQDNNMLTDNWETFDLLRRFVY